MANPFKPEKPFTPPNSNGGSSSSGSGGGVVVQTPQGGVSYPNAPAIAQGKIYLAMAFQFSGTICGV